MVVKSFSDWAERVAAWLHAEIQALLPVGYEDEEGFHFGCDHM
jgi:hypothetical protein